MSETLDIAVAIPIITGWLITGILAWPACALAVYRAEQTMSEARKAGDGPW